MGVLTSHLNGDGIRLQIFGGPVDGEYLFVPVGMVELGRLVQAYGHAYIVTQLGTVTKLQYINPKRLDGS